MGHDFDPLTKFCRRCGVGRAEALRDRIICPGAGHFVDLAELLYGESVLPPAPAEADPCSVAFSPPSSA